MVKMFYICGYRALKMWVMQLINEVSGKNKLKCNSHRCPVAEILENTDLNIHRTSLLHHSNMSPNGLKFQLSSKLKMYLIVPNILLNDL